MTSYKQRLQQIRDELFDEVLAYRHEPSSRGPNLADHPKIKLSIEKFIRDSVAIRTGEARTYLAAIHKNSNHYTGKAVGRRIHLERVYLALKHLGYLKKERGGSSLGTVGIELERYSAQPKLLKMFGDDLIQVLPAIIGSDPIEATVVFQKSEKIIHNDKAPTRKVTKLKPIETPALQTIRDKMDIINTAIDSLWIDLEMSQAEQSGLAKKMRSKKWQARNKDATPYVNLAKRLVYRVFNNVEMTRGGRFYGGWWQMIPKEARQSIVVDGKRMVEIDYKSYHPTMLFHEEGLQAPANFYEQILDKLGLIDEPLLIPQDPDEPDRVFTTRDSIKKAFNAMLNATSKLNRPPNGLHLGLLGRKWKEVEAAVLEVSQPIAKHFYSDTGARLQRIDSDISLDLLLRFATHGDGPVPCLPVHDSFLIHFSYEGELLEMMERLYKDRFGADFPEFKHKYAKVSEVEGWVDTSIDAILEYSMLGYEQRLQAYKLQ